MGGATSPQFAAAVSNAGGLGMLALGWSPPEAVRAEIRATKALTERPFGVNLVLTYPQEERLAICLEEGVAVVSFFWGQAGSLTVAAHRGGATVLHTAGSAEQARISAEDGADAIVAQGWEAGGHVYGRVATMALVPAVVDQVAPVPVLAAGGIADGRGLAAAMALGAAGALDRYPLSREHRSSNPSALSRPHPHSQGDGHRIRDCFQRRLARRSAP
ncbi:nitronate monooxygenase [Mesorhizobium sp. AR10]|uniref:nitronate monooxygenase n=1 Tax=Mesorhizobium sp. AR10 TaxID=2865839 RepID=UPI0029E7E344|nr:nitronate monooxygenase [Mesorhizobium sp. AR10]